MNQGKDERNREDHILKLSRKKKDKAKKEIDQKFMSSMSTSLHPRLQLTDDYTFNASSLHKRDTREVDESIQKINNQLNSNSLHHNSV